MSTQADIPDSVVNSDVVIPLWPLDPLHLAGGTPYADIAQAASGLVHLGVAAGVALVALQRGIRLAILFLDIFIPFRRFLRRLEQNLRKIRDDWGECLTHIWRRILRFLLKIGPRNVRRPVADGDADAGPE